MTREEAIFYLANMDRKYMEKGMSEALDMAIEALEQEPCGDCISREETLEALMDEWTEYDSELIDSLVEKIKKLPPVTPQPKMGQWIFDEVLDHHYYCSECKAMGVDYWDYCPYCGSYNGGDAE